MLHAVNLYEFTLTPSQQGENSMAESDCSLQIDPNQLATGVTLPLALFQKDLSQGADGAEVVLISECRSSGEHGELMAALLTQGHQLVMEESALGCIDEAVASLYVEELSQATEQLCEVQEGPPAQEGQEVVTYFETIPNILPSDIFTPWTIPPDTVLSSALSSKPITSTLPIVSTHVQPSPTPGVLKVDRLDRDEGDDGQSEEDNMEWQDHQLEEHWWKHVFVFFFPELLMSYIRKIGLD